MKKFWLVYRKEDAVKNRAYIEMYQKYAPEYGLECELVYMEDIRYGVRNNHPYLLWKGEFHAPYFAIVRAIAPAFSKQLELLGVRCMNSSFVSEICNDKAATYRYLSGKGIPMPDTDFIRNQDISQYLFTCPTGRVLKAVDGHGGSQVVQYSGNPEQILTLMGRSDMVAQERIGSRNSDLRVYVIGNRIIAAVLRTSKEGFRANFSLGGEVRLYKLNSTETALVNRILNEFHFDLAGIDFLIDDDGSLVFNEIEDVVGARMLYQCGGPDIVKEYLGYLSKCIDGISRNTTSKW